MSMSMENHSQMYVQFALRALIWFPLTKSAHVHFRCIRHCKSTRKISSYCQAIFFAMTKYESWFSTKKTNWFKINCLTFRHREFPVVPIREWVVRLRCAPRKCQQNNLCAEIYMWRKSSTGIKYQRHENGRTMSELNLPIIIVCSEGAKSSIEIINSKWNIVTFVAHIVCHHEYAVS